MPSFQLISATTCPFVQRSAITLNYKRIPYDIRHIDLTNKPEWFLALSPTGKVPVLVVREDDREIVLFESAVINEYLDEVTPGSLLPSDPLKKAQQRVMIEFASLALADQWRLSVTGDRAELDKHRAELHRKLGAFEQRVVGPFHAGEAFSLVDAATIPLLLRARWLEEIMPELDLFAGLPKVRGWSEAAVARPSVQRSAVPEIRELYREYVKGKRGAGGDVAPGLIGQRLS
jgi:glutathione S-transferase